MHVEAKRGPPTTYADEWPPQRTRCDLLNTVPNCSSYPSVAVTHIPFLLVLLPVEEHVLSQAVDRTVSAFHQANLPTTDEVRRVT